MILSPEITKAEEELQRLHAPKVVSAETEVLISPNHYDGPEPGQPVTEYKTAIEPPSLEINSVIQIRVEPNRGVLCQVGAIDGDAVYCYRMNGNGIHDDIVTKTGDFVLISPPRRGIGMVAMAYQRPELAVWKDQ